MARKGRRTSWPLHRDSRLGRSSGLGPLYFRTREFLSVRYEEHGLEVKEYNVYACFDMLPWLEEKALHARSCEGAGSYESWNDKVHITAAASRGPSVCETS